MANPDTISGGGVTWTVDTQQEASGQLPGGAFGPGYRVTFTTGHGLHGSVWLPESQFSPEAVRHAIAAKVKLLVAVQQLSG